MPTHSRTWKKAEGRFAALFGTTRRPLSGSNSRSGGSDDGQHEALYLEHKLRASHAAWALFLDTKAKAAAEGLDRIPVVGLSEKGRHGILLVLHSQDLPAILEAYAEAKAATLPVAAVAKRRPPKPLRVISPKE